MSETSAELPPGVDEFAQAAVPKAECTTILCPRVADAPATLECRLIDIITLRGPDNFLVIGEVFGTHLRDDCLRGGRFDVSAFTPVARLGYRDYTFVREIVELARPDDRFLSLLPLSEAAARSGAALGAAGAVLSTVRFSEGPAAVLLPAASV